MVTHNDLVATCCGKVLHCKRIYVTLTVFVYLNTVFNYIQLSPSDVKQENFMNLEDKLRLTVLWEYGFNDAINDKTISEKDLILIQQASTNDIIQDKITHIFKKRAHEKVAENVKMYKKFQYLNGFAAARARSQSRDKLQNLMESVKYISDFDKSLIETVLTN